MKKRILFIIVIIPFYLSCSVSIPEKATPVNNFVLNSYLGTWYEIARTPNRFEKNLTEVTATYTRKSNGTIEVVNKGYDTKKEKWKSATGKAKFVENSDVGRLKVSFFGPFYASYNIIKLTEDYQYALVVGNDTDYAWLLSRTQTIPNQIEEDFLREAEEIGIDLSSLIYAQDQ